MKEHLAALVRASRSVSQARNVAREYLQARVMASLQRAGAMIPLAFHGGTALRFLYSLPRYSEDLGFALERPGPGYDFRAYLRAVRSDLEREGYAVDVTVSDQKTVHSAFVRFIGLVYELRLSLHRDEVLRVKIEVDTNPPAGAILATSVVRRHVTLQLQHHDPASLLAGKLHAVLHRPYPKGRDIYDLLWYLSDRQWPAPNLAMLGNALQQTGWHGVQPTKDSWRHIVRQRIETVDWQRLVADVGPFLEDGLELAVFTRENLLQVLERE